MEKRVKKVFSSCDEKPDAILIKNSSEPYIDTNFFYVTGLTKGLFEGSAAVLYPDGNVDLIVPELEAALANKANANVKIYKNQKDFQNHLLESFSHCKNIGLNFSTISHEYFLNLLDKFSNLGFFDISKAFTESRLIKDEFEINLIRKACEIVDRVVDKIPQILYEGMAEFELAAEIDYLMGKNGADKTAFETISSFNVNSALPHYSHGDTKLKKNDFVLCDFGACFKKYNSDITRTFVYGTASEMQKEMYETVFEAQKIGLEKARAGVKACNVHDAVESYINGTKFKGRFIHSTGHSLGLSVHDGGQRLGAGCDMELREGMVYTIEPGVYIPEIGGVRIEDDVLIKKDGTEILTKSPRQLVEI